LPFSILFSILCAFIKNLLNGQNFFVSQNTFFFVSRAYFCKLYSTKRNFWKHWFVVFAFFLSLRLCRIFYASYVSAFLTTKEYQPSFPGLSKQDNNFVHNQCWPTKSCMSRNERSELCV
jgi:hypothetical protein